MAAAKTTATKQEPLLDLNTLIERPKIKIDGKTYEILSPDELSILDSQRFETWGRRIEALAKDEDKSDELDTLIDQVTGKILIGVPQDVWAKLSKGHKVRVIAVFTGLLLGDQLGAAGATLKVMSRLIGEKSSPASSVSLAATRAGGSKKHRRPS
ncbi:MAG: hypothetical protein P1V13_22145 [Rhizobiaceae bacterium]|nr:hypothetical protein [Rhizobiaceae bacterium]